MIKQNTKLIEQLKEDNTLLRKEQSNELNQLRGEIEIIKAEKSSPPPLIEETTEQLRTNPSKWDVDC